MTSGAPGGPWVVSVSAGEGSDVVGVSVVSVAGTTGDGAVTTIEMGGRSDGPGCGGAAAGGSVDRVPRASMAPIAPTMTARTMPTVNVVRPLVDVLTSDPKKGNQPA